MITHGDVLDVLQGTPDETYSGCFCDPPYGLGETPDMVEVLTHWLAGDDYKARGGGFMGRTWDAFVPGPAIWKEVYRVLNPGAILIAFGGTRTADLLSIAIRLAGFERFDEISYHYGSLPGRLDWVFGNGFPKGCDISKQIDKDAGAVREVVGTKKSISHIERGDTNIDDQFRYMVNGYSREVDRIATITAPATDAARTWQGYGTALKPAHEPVLLFRKPRRATYAQTALQHGTGCLNIDGCRIESDGTHASSKRAGRGKGFEDTTGNGVYRGVGGVIMPPHPQGRWPANVVLDDEAGRLLDEQSGERPTGGPGHTKTGRPGWGFSDDRLTIGYGDTGGASRFFYCAKSSRAEREAGLEGLPLRDKPGLFDDDNYEWKQTNGHVKAAPARNNHPCVKPLALTEYLARLIVPPVEYRDAARLLVPFCGSGSEILGALRAGWLHIDGIDNEASYIEIAERRIAHELSKLEQFEQQLRLI